MQDFEVHPIGTREEIRLSRALARAVEETQRSTAEVPSGIMYAYKQLLVQYNKMIEEENL